MTIDVWWFFGETPTTREGITADLEAFKQQGVGGVVYYDPTRFYGCSFRELPMIGILEVSDDDVHYHTILLNNDEDTLYIRHDASDRHHGKCTDH